MTPEILKTTRVGKTVCRLATTLGVLVLSFSLVAQGNFGRILGTVTDQTGAVLAGAAVTIIDVDRGLSRSLVTDSAGEYNAPTLIPGNYSVRVEVKGFRTLTRQNIVLEVGKEVQVDLTPQPGEQSQTVTVEAAAPLIESTNATLGGTLNNADINDMPLNGRNYQNLLSLRPGVTVYAGGSPWTQSSNNARPDENVWMLDGIINANFYDYRPISGMPSPFTDGATILPVDAIQEFNLEENPKAEYGWRPGAVVNVGIRSGTNSYHGSAYAFGRYDAWAARNFFNPAPNDKLPTELKQFGGVVGGPIKKDKLFFFGGYEGLRSLVGNAIGSNVPATGSLGGDTHNSMVDAITALQKAGVTPNPVSLKLFGCTLGPVTCNGGLIQGASPNSTTFVSSFPNTNISDNGVGKMDYQINSKHAINGLLLVGNYLGNGEDHPVTSAIWQNGNPLRTYTVTANWIWTASSNLVNNARFGYNKVYFALIPDDASLFANGKDYALNTGITSTGGFPNVTISGFAGEVLGSWRGRPLEFTNPYSNIQDNLSFLTGKHSFKFGGEFANIDTDFNIHDTRGRIDFRGKQTPQIVDAKGNPSSTPLEDFFAGLPQRGSQLVGTTARTLVWKSYAGFFQDDWRIAPRVILNLGLRYSYISPMRDINNLIGNFDPTSATGLVQQGQASIGDSIWKPDKKNWSPRVGFAWDITGKGTTVVRGGASIIYSMFTPAQFVQSPFQNFTGGAITATPTGGCTVAVPVGTPCPKTFGGTIDLGTAQIPGASLNWSGPVFPVGAVTSCTAKAPCNLTVVDPNLRVPYLVNWNLGIQHAFSNNLSLEVGYVGNHGDRLTGFLDLNQTNPATGIAPYASQFPYLNFINQTTNDAHSNYHSLQTTLTKRLSHGLSFTAGYTYGHGLDNGSLNRFGLLPQSSLNPGAEYGNSDFDIRHRFTLTATYTIPGKKGYGQLLAGWKLNAIVSLQSGMPWIVNDTGNNFSGSGDLSDRWNFTGSPSDFRSGSQSIPYCVGPDQIINGQTVGGCSVTSGVSGIQSFFSVDQSKAMWAQCTAVASDPTPGGTLDQGGCFVKGNSVMTPPKMGSYGSMGRNLFRDSGFRNVDFSVFKNFRLKERMGAEFRVEFFNLFNHPIIANPYGAANGAQVGWDPSAPSTFGCGCSTPDVAAGNPLVGSGSSRVMQLGLKLTF
jgi:hypothetical protein